MANSRWCCLGMETAYGARAERGIFAYVEPPSRIQTEPWFFLAMRATNQQSLESAAILELGELGPVTLLTRTIITCCPWCGKKLARFYRSDYDMLVDPSISAEFAYSGDVEGEP